MPEKLDVDEGVSDDVITTDGEYRVLCDDENGEKERRKKSNNPQNPDGDGHSDTRGGSISTRPPIDYTNTNVIPYEHNFEEGDHIIRWDMLPILWPIQIHGIVLKVSEDKSEVTICDFGITSVKNEKEDGKTAAEQNERIVEEENAKFTEAIQNECQDSENDELLLSKDTSLIGKDPVNKKRQRLNVVKLTKWSDLKKWHKVDYEGGLLNVGRKSGVGKGLKTLGKKTEELWTSMRKSFITNDGGSKGKNIPWRLVRYNVNEKGYCVHHPDIQLKFLKDDGDWAVFRKKCPECIMEDCPVMMGEITNLGASSVDSSHSFSAKEGEPSGSHSKIGSSEATLLEETSTIEEMNPNEPASSGALEESAQPNGEVDNEPPSQSIAEKAADGSMNHHTHTDLSESDPGEMEDDRETLAQMIAKANEVEKRSRKAVATPNSWLERKSMGEKQRLWHVTLMESLSHMFPQKSEQEGSINTDLMSEKKHSKSLLGENRKEAMNGEKQPNFSKEPPRSDPPILVLARAQFILEHGENILPPYHIINSNSECIAVWCKTGRWSTLQASVFLHSTAIGHAKSATALTLGVAATQPWLIPAFATVGIAAVGTPWLFLKVANDKWNVATMALTEKFWMQAEPEVFVECVEKWGRIV